MKQDSIVFEMGFTAAMVALAVISSASEADGEVIVGCFLISLLPWIRRFFAAIK